MKIHRLFIQLVIFLIILISFVLPSVIFIPEPASEISFPLSVTVYFALSVFLYYFTKNYVLKNQDKEKFNKKALLIRNTGITTLTFGIIFSAGMIFNIIAWFTDVKDPYFTLPSGKIQYFYVIFAFVLAAFNEEVLYRFYIPEQIFSLCSARLNEKVSFWISEIISMALFALGHRYRGILAVVNAAIAYAVLRICFKKSKSIVPGTIAHMLYNILSFILAVILS